MSHASRRLLQVEYFDVVQSIARTALGGGRAAVTQQIERLAGRLAEDGSRREANSLLGIVSRANRTQAVEPLDLVPASGNNSPALARLTTRTPLPVDRESSAPLCEVVFPGSPVAAPVLSEAAESAWSSLVDEWRHEERLRAADLSVSRSLLLYGPPGTGKTSLALLLASRLQRPAVVARLDGLISSLLGNTARNLGGLFEFCNRFDVVLVLDEFDAVAKVRDDPNEVGEIKRVVNALLQNLDRRRDHGLTIAITNHEQLLDRAVWRRFEHQIQLALPNSEIRGEIASRHLLHAGSPPALTKAIAWLTDGLSGSDVRALSLATMKAWILSDQPSPDMSHLIAAAASTGARLRPAAQEAVVSASARLAVTLHSEANMSIVELAQLLGRDRKTVGRWLQT